MTAPFTTPIYTLTAPYQSRPTLGTGDYCEREGTDRNKIELPAGQEELVLALRAANPGAPLVAVLVHGGAIAFSAEVLGALDGIVDAWQPGIRGADHAHAILPYTWI